MSLRFLSALLRLRRLARQSALLARSSQAVKLRLRHFVRLMWKSKREVLWQKNLLRMQQSLLLFLADLLIILRFSQSLRPLLSSFWEKIFPRLLLISSKTFRRSLSAFRRFLRMVRLRWLLFLTQLQLLLRLHIQRLCLSTYPRRRVPKLLCRHSLVTFLLLRVLVVPTPLAKLSLAGFMRSLTARCSIQTVVWSWDTHLMLRTALLSVSVASVSLRVRFLPSNAILRPRALQLPTARMSWLQFARKARSPRVKLLVSMVSLRLLLRSEAVLRDRLLLLRLS